MFRAIGLVILLALGASAATAEEKREIAATQARITAQLNAAIAKRVTLELPAPPANLDENAPALKPVRLPSS